MAFTALGVFIFLLALRGGKPTGRTYMAVAAAALVASIWEYVR